MPNSFFPRADLETRTRLERNETMKLANGFDWSKTELGPVPGWPEALRAAVRMVLASDVPMFIMAGRRDGVLIYNQGYAAFAGDRHPGLFGSPVLEAWPEIADFNRDNMARGFRGESWYLRDQELVLNRTGTFESAWMNLNYSPVLMDDGTAVGVLVVVMETTDQVRAAQRLADSEQQFRMLTDTMPQMVWSALPDGRHDYYNARWYEFTGLPEGSTEGPGWEALFHPDDRLASWTAWQNSLATGEPFYTEYRLRHHSGDYRWVLGWALPIRDAAGRITRWFGTSTDIHEQKLIAEERTIVAQELSHRIKNIFSVINGLFSLTARANPEVAHVAENMRERIFALGRAHELLRPHTYNAAPQSSASSLHALVRELLLPYEVEGGGRIVISGDDVAIDDGAATPLALLFHELATNAAKYGALLREGGTVEISARLNGDQVHMSWRETGAGGGATPDHEGFGGRLMGLSVERQMRGTLRREWTADGLLVEIEVPAEALSRQAALRSRPSGASGTA